MFPIEIKLKKRFNVPNTYYEKTNAILEFFKQEFENRKADNVRIENNEVIFKNKFFKFTNNWNIMVPVDQGRLSIKNDNRGEIEIEYLFSLKTILIIGALGGVIFGLVSKLWYIGLGTFLWIGGVNWLIALIRHSLMFRKLNNTVKIKFLQ